MNIANYNFQVFFSYGLKYMKKNNFTPPKKKYKKYISLDKMKKTPK